MAIPKREVALKASIKDIVEGKYERVDDELKPNAVVTKNGQRISRANIMGIVISKIKEEKEKIILDDGSANIAVTFFDENNKAEDFDIGDILMVIGKPREFNNSIFMAPEIIKKINDPNWIKLRKTEMGKRTAKEKQEEVTEEKVDNTEKIIQTIKQLDNGDGANFEEVITKTNDPKCENIINYLIEQGEVFELRPGKLKILE